MSEIVPSMEGSIEPMTMRKVTPIAAISAGAEAMAIRAKLRSEKKVGLSAVKRITSVTRTSRGAHRVRTSRGARGTTGLPLGGDEDGGAGVRAAGGPQRQR